MEKRTSRTIRFWAAEFQHLAKYAKQAGKSLPQYVRDLVRKDMKEIETMMKKDKYNGQTQLVDPTNKRNG